MTLLPLPTLLLLLLSSLPSPARGDALDDLWSQYVQQAEAAKYESTAARRERNLDHWDVPTAAAYLGLHPETLAPLPRFAPEGSSTDAAAAGGGATNSRGDAVVTAASLAAPTDLADEYVGHDAAALFYAQWCRNCHAAAPSWDAVATHLNAGTRASNLVLALFDCEKNARHMELCKAAGVTAYPTFMFVGSGEFHDTDVVTSSILGKDKSAGPYGATTLRRTVKFQGNWQYADQILDWVNIMRGLSSWHSVNESGPLRGLRNGLFRLITGGKYKGKGNKMGKGGSLPVGVPPNFQPELRGINAGGGAGASAQEVKDLETKLNDTTTEKELYSKAVKHSSQLIDGLLFRNDTAARDPFSVLTASDGWFQNATSLPPGAPGDEHPAVLRLCVLELTIDYCTRITTRRTASYLEELGAIPESDPFPTLEEIEQRLTDDVKGEEPYCGLIEACVLGDFAGEECRAGKCPFVNEAACGYVGNCLDPGVQDEYALALGLIGEGEKLKDKDWSGAGDGAGGSLEGSGGSDTEAQEGASANAGVGGWGIPVQ